MKKISLLTILLSLFSLMCQMAWAEDKPMSPQAYLNAMTNAHRQLNYEQLYIVQQGENVQSLRFRHANYQGKEYAQLLRLDNTREEIILRNNMVSYFGEFQPFSLPNNKIIDDLPSVIYADFNQLKGYYFVDAGRTRVADKLARIIRIVPRDEFRYQYVLWIDEETHLLLRSDLLDRDRNVLEQFKVIQSSVNEQLLYIIEPIESLILPTLIQPKIQPQSHNLTWQPNWLPSGFKVVSAGQQRLSDITFNEPVESQLYSDGLFTFTVYNVENKGLIFNEQFWRQGKLSIYSQTVGDRDLVIVGEIPLVSARHIVQEIRLSQNNEVKQPLVEGGKQ
ncbi:MucB/RseB-like sigma(E) regulatory protein [Vespertiliibacter pulmonis]|uniref:MucB/RseB-like sigma(E) regulatory protein n=1 Tax=Vespertiliibacter pulmonis TaxID=1443036 RepID=A0A3N4W0A2_9PAST|nr:MucB/RseB C-terminal domain-containing protein [Vespertiliibacter pulmonis]RPE85759.1 MucB/RseB-like sigma(E) regulatory protein [Vespertiliibacter pulmonis]